MHSFLVKMVQGKITPVLSSKKAFLDKILQHYQDSGKNFTITIQENQKSINTEQIRLYNAFVIKASNEYGCEFNEMENILLRFKPFYLDDRNSPLPVKQWTTKQLNNFINQASSLLSEQGFNF